MRVSPPLPSVYSLALFRAYIARQSFAVLAIFDGFCGAAADARHAVCTVRAPDRFALFQADIAKRTDVGAFAAGYTAVCNIKLFGMYGKRIKQVVYNTTAQPIS